MESAITIKGGYVDGIKVSEKTIDYSIEEDIVINKFDGEMNLSNIK